ncbi:ATP-dependent helicase HrpA [Allochromatium warmingii]|uniref:ATP-dependent helicase HrpA n=1 Tax=Allochromatium warmingii TaxID=61595 RepID=A0A1H3GB18_ALLWA|nr:ATP-dependent RNA helicase HrpA [Allochromatium warmingii]SDX99704.1 ATP-dependent helicase HrpA [Allochromatium warmingii]
MNFPTEHDIAGCLIRDRYSIQSRLRNLRRRARAGQPIDEALTKLWACIQASQLLVAQRQALVPIINYPPELPVSERRDEVAALIERHQVIVLCGETGSGKSTQLPKLCLDLGRGRFGRIGHTQPRRLAARSLASRVAQELGVENSGLVGYKVRFHDRVRPETAIKLMTDGMLLAEIQQDRWLNDYDTLIIDEAHERGLNIDFLLGYLKGLLPHRPDLKLIVTSATIDPERFARHFTDSEHRPAPIIEISGRTYPVEIRYRPPEEASAAECDESMQRAISEAVEELARVGRGDVLVFLSGEREIRTTAETLRAHHPPSTEILPLFARQGPQEQARIFQPHGTRRVILATNVAETSLTVPGIHYVIDPGFARISRYSHRTKVQRLPVERISQASANQRSGRCGRIAAGVCIRLYSADQFSARTEFTEPEIARANLAAVILQMKQLGFGAIEHFPFIDRPDSRLINDGYRTLEELGALDDRGELTTLGRQLARLPVDPRIGRMLLAAAENHCLAEVLIIAAALSVQDPRERPHDKQQTADEIHASFNHPESDFITFLNLWHFLDRERHQLSRNKFLKLCQRHFLSWNRVQEWRDIHAQLREQLLEMGFREQLPAANYQPLANADPIKLAAGGWPLDADRSAAIHRAILTGLLGNIGFREAEREFQGARNSRFFIHPSSALFARPPKWVMVAERVETTRHYGRIAASIQPSWIEHAAGHLLQRSYSEPHWQAKSGQVAAFETVTLFGITLVTKRRVNYGPINPAEAREIFLRFALTEGDFHTRAPFWRHNRELIDYVHHLEAKSRRRDILVDDEAIYAFYAERVPTGIYSTPQFERWLRQVTRQTPKILHLRLSDLMRHAAAEITADVFPDQFAVGATALPLEYRFDPGAITDGVTLVVPLPLINQVSPDRLDWLVPGLLEERITALLRGLPKTLRKAFVPIPDTAKRLAARLKPSDRPLIQALAEEIRALSGVQIPEDAWDQSVIPPHLRMKIRLIDETGQALAIGDDPLALKRQFAAQGAQGFTQLPNTDTALERTGVTRWTFGDLPETVDLTRAGIQLRGYPALVDQGDTVAINVLDSADNAAIAHRAGLRRLIMLHLSTDIRQLRKHLPNLDRMRLQYAKAPVFAAQPADLADEIIALSLDLTFIDHQPPLRTQAIFEQRLATGSAQLIPTAQAVCQLIGAILSDYHALRKRLAAIIQVNWMPSILDIREQLDSLIFRGFPQQIPYCHLEDYPRYLKALAQRIERLAHAPDRDRRWMQEMAGIQTRWRERNSAAKTAGRHDARLDEIRWLLEELRVSLFAQQLGTAYPVSVKRIEARWKELGL